MIERDASDQRQKKQKDVSRRLEREIRKINKAGKDRITENDHERERERERARIIVKKWIKIGLKEQVDKQRA